MKRRWKYRKEFKQYCKDIDLEHKRKSPITGNFLWFEFLEKEKDVNISDEIDGLEGHKVIDKIREKKKVF